MVESLLPYLWVALTAFLAGRWTVEKSVAYRLGLKVLADTKKILDNRHFVGKEDFTISAHTFWESEGQKWALTLKQHHKE